VQVLIGSGVQDAASQLTAVRQTAAQLAALHLAGVQITSWTPVRHLIPIGVAGGMSWTVWLVRMLLSRLYRPLPAGYRTSTSVIVPSYREDPEILDRCLDSFLRERPSEVIVVPDLDDIEVIDRLLQRSDPRLIVIPFAHQGKRSALGVGIRAATSEILILADSDTEWLPGLLEAVQAPFVDPSVGGVGTRQNAYLPRSSVWRRVANWLIDIRYLDYVPSQSRSGAVACLSGRTAAYRREAILEHLQHLEHEFFLGRRCVAGDDGRLTWLTLASGYRTVYQSSARTVSMFPDSFSAFVKQRVRWSRNSYRCYLTAMWKGWLWRQPLICQVSVLQVMLTPITMGIALFYLVRWFEHPQHYLASIAIGWLLLGRAVRGLSHLRRNPGDIVVLPLVALMTVFIAVIIKSYALVTMNRQGWLTRDTYSVGGEGQAAASLGVGTRG
jgi:cellulose synthase/poly-beta-1,6-N-acetylglucosamine synthase-like glycosyltransferase